MSKLKLSHWFGLWLALMLLIVMTTQPESRPDKLDSIDFQTTESAELYFRNVRAYHYLHKEEGGDIFDVYRLKSLYADTSQVALPFAIYNNWRANEAFIRLDTVHLDKQWRVVVRDSLGIFSNIALPEMYNESQYTFAVEVYRSLNREYPMALINDHGDTLRVEGDPRKYSLRTLTDYFKLVGKL